MKLRLVLADVGWLVPMTAHERDVETIQACIPVWLHLGSGTPDDPRLSINSSAVIAYEVIEYD